MNESDRKLCASRSGYDDEEDDKVSCVCSGCIFGDKRSYCDDEDDDICHNDDDSRTFLRTLTFFQCEI